MPIHNRYTGAGLLPFVFDTHQPYFILFRNKKHGKYEDPGGTVQNQEWKKGFPHALKLAAIREGREESCNTIQAKEHSMQTYLDSYYPKANTWYRCFLYPIPKKSFSIGRYQDARHQIEQDTQKTKYWKETDDAQYFDLKELYRVYQASLEKHTVDCLIARSRSGKKCRLSPRILAVLDRLFRKE